jgi:hypothetical protein
LLERSTNPGRNYRRGSFLGQLTVRKIERRRWRPLIPGFTMPSEEFEF